MFEMHTAEVQGKQRAHQDDIEIQKNQIQQLKNQIIALKRDNKETMHQIDNDAKQEIDQIESKNQASLSQVKDMGLRSSAELQLTGTKLKKVQKEIDRVVDQIKHKEQ